jgi:hypothetical protein
MDSLNSQISNIQSSLLKIDNDIAAIDSCDIQSELQDLINACRIRLVEKKSNLNDALSTLQLELANYTFNSYQQVVVNDINVLFENKYQQLLSDFQSADSLTKNHFFHLYSLADNDILRECVIMQFFLLPLHY